MKAINSPKARTTFWEKLSKDHGPQKLEIALLTVTEPSQRILRLCYHEHKTFTEIMGIIGKSLSIVRGYHSQGMIQLVKKLYPQLDSPFDILNVRYE